MRKQSAGKKKPPARKKTAQKEILTPEIQETNSLEIPSPSNPEQPVAEYLDREELARHMAKLKGVLSNQMTPQMKYFIKCQSKIIGIFSGNQAGKTHTPAFGYFLRMIDSAHMKHKNHLSKHVRCLAPMQPEGTDEEAEHAAQYVEIKKLFPPEMIKKDITARNKTMCVASKTYGKSYFEFVSTKQELQTTGGVQRSSLWEDEEAPKDFREEGKMRLLAEDGDEIISLTPVNGLSHLYWDVWMRAKTIWRTQTVADAFNWPRREIRETGDPNITCIQMATDDNPTLSPSAIEAIFADIDDPDTLAIRRYGVFKQIMGKVHKSYNTQIHYLNTEKYFPQGIPYEWKHARGIDYHESRIPWSIGWLAASPNDEWFLYQEFHPPIDGPHSMTTYEICKSIARKSGDYEFLLNLIDPLAGKKQPNTGFSTIEDMNRIFQELREDEGLGSRHDFWQPWDTKNEKGRDEIKARFKNGASIGKPFNNLVLRHGEKTRLPTLWILDRCPNFSRSLERWSYLEHVQARVKQVNDPPSKPQQRWSHDCMVLECLAKDIRLKSWKNVTPISRIQYSQSGRPIYEKRTAGNRF